MDHQKFSTVIWDYFHTQGRSFAWRQTDNPYHIIVSEVMLQQTQTLRVEQKYAAFVDRFPSFEVLAQAPLRDVLLYWQGLGYNRRALALQVIAKKVMEDYAGSLPADPEILDTFPSIGKATAASICAFAFNRPTVFIETNIRTVFMYFFFQQQEKVYDKEIYPLVELTVDQERPRLWYYALMDYGVMLKKEFPLLQKKSAHYNVQSCFEGSDRQLRGRVLKTLTEHSVLGYQELATLLSNDIRLPKIIDQLCHEGFIKNNNETFSLG